MADREDAQPSIPKWTYTALQALQMTQEAIENEQNNGFLSEDSLDEDEEQDSKTESPLLQATRVAADDAADEHVESDVDNSVGSDFEVDCIDPELKFEDSTVEARGRKCRWGGRETEEEDEVCHWGGLEGSEVSVGVQPLLVNNQTFDLEIKKSPTFQILQGVLD